MTLNEYTDLINKKLEGNNDIITFSYYELRIKYNLSESEVEDVLKASKSKFENLGYDVFFTGAKYTYRGVSKVVQDNELMVAIKK